MDDKRYSCEHAVPIEQEPRHHLVIENEFVRAFAVEIAPHDRTLCHHHPHDYLLYVAGDGDIVSVARDEEPKKLSYRDGECELLQAGMVHVVENLADTPFRNVVVELLPGVVGLRRGTDPKLITGEATIVQRFADETAAIFEVDMESEAEVAVFGPAVVASPYGQEVEVAAEENSSKLTYFNELGWLGWNSKAILRNRQKAKARVMISVVGRDLGTKEPKTQP